MTMLARDPGGAPAAGDPRHVRYGVAAALSPVPVPGAPPGTFTPGVLASGAERDGDRIVRITRLAHAVPGKPDGEVDTRPLRPAWYGGARRGWDPQIAWLTGEGQ